jgi:hypothetical protein
VDEAGSRLCSMANVDISISRAEPPDSAAKC